MTVLFALLSTACNGTSDSEPGSAETINPSVEPSETPAGEFISDKANVESIDILMLESFPVQVNVVAQGYYPDGCTEISNSEQESLGEYSIGLIVYTIRPVDAVCTQATVPFEETFPLDVDGLPEGTYTVDVNGVTGTFELEVDNIAMTELDTTCPSGTVDLKQFLNGQDGYCLLHPAWYQASVHQSGATVLSGPRFGEGIEQVEVSISIDNLGSANGLSAEEIAETQLSEVEPDDVGIDWGSISLGGEEAITADGVPGIINVRQAFVIHEDIAYMLTLSPVDTSMLTASQEAELLWDTVVASFTFIEQQEVLSANAVEGCTPNSEFVGDVTMPDGTEVVVGTTFVKTWRMRNNGTCVWDGTYQLVQADTSGNLLVAYPHAVSLPETQPGEEVDLSVTLELSADAPLHTEQVGQFQMRTLSGKHFGATPFVKVVAVSGSSSEGPVPAGSSMTGIVWNDVCALSEGGLPTDECVEDDEGGYRANGIIDEREVGIGGITVSLVPGECATVVGTFTTVTSGDGSYGFYGLTPGPYCIFVDPLLDSNFSILIPGGFTSPRLGEGGLTVFVNQDENAVVNFGWDYTFD